MEDLHIYCDEMEAQLKEWDAKLERLKLKTKLGEGDSQLELGDEINFLNLKKRALEEKLHELREATGDACLIIKEDLNEALRDLETSFENADSKFR